MAPWWKTKLIGLWWISVTFNTVVAATSWSLFLLKVQCDEFGVRVVDDRACSYVNNIRALKPYPRCSLSLVKMQIMNNFLIPDQQRKVHNMMSKTVLQSIMRKCPYALDPKWTLSGQVAHLHVNNYKRYEMVTIWGVIESELLRSLRWTRLLKLYQNSISYFKSMFRSHPANTTASDSQNLSNTQSQVVGLTVRKYTSSGRHEPIIVS